MALVGLGAGASAFVGFGLYHFSTWGSLCLVFLALALGLWIGSPALPRGPALAAIGGLAALWLWSLLSTRWAESANAALVASGRWLLYAVVLLTLVLLLRRRELERPLVAAATAPLLGLAAYLLIRMAFGDGAGLFLANRLNDPLEYINGLAAYLLLGFWPMIALAERARPPLAAGAAVAAAVMLVGLAVLTQSRGAIAALVLSGVIMLALVPGRLRRGWALVIVVAAVAAYSGPIGDVLAALPPGAAAPPSDAIATAARAIAIAGLVAGLAWGVASAAGAAVQDRVAAVAARRISLAALIAIGVAGLLVAAFPVGQRADQVENQYRSFTQLQVTGSGDRLVSGGGHRYDYWRIALDQFRDHPLEGIGAGNYDTTYFRERRTTEDVTNPHSIELQALGETGLIGALALALFAGGVLAALWRRARRQSEHFDPGLAVAAGGTFLVWLLQTSVDWMHLIPGLTGVALCAAAALFGPSVRQIRLTRARVTIATIAVAGGGALVALPLIADHYVASGRNQLATDPAAALEDARKAVALNGESTAAYQIEAAAFARSGDYESARRALLEATRREPSDFVNWGLLGDLAARRGDTSLARRYYARAAALNPRGPGLAALARGQGSAP